VYVRGKKQQMWQRQCNAQHPDAQRYTQRHTASHSLAQWIHNGHVPEIRRGQLECRDLIDGWNFVAQTTLNFEVM